MISTPDGPPSDVWRPLARVAWANLVVGIASPMGLTVTLLSEGVPWGTLWIFVLIDALPASFAVASAWFLLRKEKRSFKVTYFSGSAILVPALVSLLKLGRNTLFGFRFYQYTQDVGSLHMLSLLGVRLLFNGFQVTYWLVALGVLFHYQRRQELTSEDRNSIRKQVLGFCFLGALAGAYVVACQVGVLGVLAERPRGR